MRLLVTRPAAQAHAWVERLRAAGVDAQPLPLIAIVPPDDACEVVNAWHRLPSKQLAFFVSPNAVAHFFALQPAGGHWPAGLQAASPGPGSTQALVDAGVPRAAIVEPAADAPQFDSETLWQQLRQHDWAGAQVLIVRGTSGRDWLAERLTEAGATLDFVAAYRRSAPSLHADEQTLLNRALAEPAAHLWFFSSSEAIDHLEALAPGREWAQAQALATHPRIAERARRLGFGQVHEARPSFDAVIGCIQSLAS